MIEEYLRKAYAPLVSYINKEVESGKKIALWGAGNKGNTFLKIADEKRNISFVFDKDESKWGNHLPTGHEIVDYKTNQSIEPAIYFNQLACYRHAIAQMMGVKDEKKIRCFLYYLRFGKAVDITENCDSIDCAVDFIDYTKAEGLLQ